MKHHGFNAYSRADCARLRSRLGRGPWLAALILYWLAPQPVEADSLRCGRKVVREGDSSAVVLERCGQPGKRDAGHEDIWLEDGLDRVRVERWYYKRSSRSLERVVWLYQGRVVGVKSGSR